MAVRFRHISIVCFLLALTIAVFRSTWLFDLSSDSKPQFAAAALFLIGSISNWIGREKNGIKDKFGPINYLFIAYCLWVTTSLFWTINKPESAKQAILFLAVSGFAFTAYLWRWNNQRQITNDITVLFVFISILSIMGFVLVMLGVAESIGDYNRFRGILVNPTYTGAVGAMAAPIGIYLLSQYQGIIKLYISIGITLGITTSLAGGARGAIIAVIGAIIVSIYFSRKVDALYSFGSVIAAITLWIPFISGAIVRGSSLFSGIENLSSTPFNSGPTSHPDNISQSNVFQRSEETDISSGRVDIYISAIEFITQSPLIGFGFRTSKQVLGIGMETHNSYLGILLEVGLIGFALFVCFLLTVFKLGGYTPFAGVAVYVLIKEFTDSMLLGSGGVYAAIAWFMLFAYARLGILAGADQRNMFKKILPRFLFQK